MASQGFLDQLRAAHGMGMASVRDSTQRSADQNNTVSGNPGLANNVGAYQAPRPPMIRPQGMPNIAYNAPNPQVQPGQMPINPVDTMTYAAPRPPGLRQQMLDPRMPANIQYGDPRVRQPVQTMPQLAPQPMNAQANMGSRDIMAGGGRYMFPRSTSAR
jgi:hypothetical protein